MPILDSATEPACEGCSVCGEYNCGWLFDCGDHDHAQTVAEMDAARWSKALRRD